MQDLLSCTLEMILFHHTLRMLLKLKWLKKNKNRIYDSIMFLKIFLYFHRGAEFFFFYHAPFTSTSSLLCLFEGIVLGRHKICCCYSDLTWEFLFWHFTSDKNKVAAAITAQNAQKNSEHEWKPKRNSSVTYNGTV